MVENRKSINPYDFIESFFGQTGLLVTMDKEGNQNVMALDWKTIGELWSLPIITVAVAPSRYSFKLLTEGVKEFTLNIPSSKISKAISIAGSFSGRNTNKFQKANLEIIPGKRTKVPTIKDSLLSYECKIIHETDSGTNISHHLYFGKILAAYALTETIK
ncbi:MAG: flavin reductase family protein [Candidatus Lokiarchaeota archaeon]